MGIITNSGTLGTRPPIVSGTHALYSQTQTLTGVTGIETTLNSGSGGAQVTYEKLTINGIGTKPAGWP